MDQNSCTALMFATSNGQEHIRVLLDAWVSAKAAD